MESSKGLRFGIEKFYWVPITFILNGEHYKLFFFLGFLPKSNGEPYKATQKSDLGGILMSFGG